MWVAPFFTHSVFCAGSGNKAVVGYRPT